jgi:hypothetical protein
MQNFANSSIFTISNKSELATNLGKGELNNKNDTDRKAQEQIKQ